MLEIKHMIAEDVDELYNLVEKVPEFRVNADTVNFWPKSTLARASKSDDILALIAKGDNKIIGFTLASYSDGLRKATIENIYVTPEQRGHGLGDLLLGELEESLKNAGCEYIATLIPTSAAGAADLYTKAGFSKGETFIWLDKSLTATFRNG